MQDGTNFVFVKSGSYLIVAISIFFLMLNAFSFLGAFIMTGFLWSTKWNAADKKYGTDAGCAASPGRVSLYLGGKGLYIQVGAGEAVVFFQNYLEIWLRIKLFSQLQCY